MSSHFVRPVDQSPHLVMPDEPSSSTHLETDSGMNTFIIARQHSRILGELPLDLHCHFPRRLPSPFQFLSTYGRTIHPGSSQSLQHPDPLPHQGGPRNPRRESGRASNERWHTTHPIGYLAPMGGVTDPSMHPIPDHGSTDTLTSSNSTSSSSSDSTSSLRHEDVSDQDHGIIAIAKVVHKWDGVIPGRFLSGLPLKPGKKLLICNIHGNQWLHVHQDGKYGCRYIPSTYVRIENWFIPPPPHLQTVEMMHHGLPPAPFEREPNDREYNENRILVFTDCEEPGACDLFTISFTFELIAAPSSKFTGLSFKVKLPPGHSIAEVEPKDLARDQTHAHVSSYQTTEVSGTVSAGTIELDYERRNIYSVDFSQNSKGKTVGAGKNSGVASWHVSEDAISKSGLNRKMTFSIKMSTVSAPPKVTCSYNVKLAKGRGDELLDGFDQHWDVSFMHPPQPQGWKSWIRQKIRPM